MPLSVLTVSMKPGAARPYTSSLDIGATEHQSSLPQFVQSSVLQLCFADKTPGVVTERSAKGRGLVGLHHSGLAATRCLLEATLMRVRGCPFDHDSPRLWSRNSQRRS